MPEELVLRNTMSRSLEPFEALEPGHVRMYTCGPTVYNYVHIGNLRTFLFEDVLRRTLRLFGYRITQVMNLTDVDDKTIRGAREAGLGLREYTDRYIEAFFKDMDTLRAERAEHYPRATDYIPQMVRLIQRLTEKGHTYRAEGSIYYRISTFPGYGKLSGIRPESTLAGARVDADEYEKDDARDFVLWKAPKPGEPSWDTELGPGRPGWHLECSAMSMELLGETFDIHTGAVDNVFPHHENEIAQSEGATGKPFVRYWLHAEHLIVEGQKMAKSAGNFFTLRDLLERGHDPVTIRYLLISVPYRQKLNFTFDGFTTRPPPAPPATSASRPSRASEKSSGPPWAMTSTQHGPWELSTPCSGASTPPWTAGGSANPSGTGWTPPWPRPTASSASSPRTPAPQRRTWRSPA